MALRDFFKPKWKNPDDLIRMEGVKTLKDQETLYRIAEYDFSEAVREAAVRRLTDRDVLKYLAENSTHTNIRAIAYVKLGQPEMALFCTVQRTDVDVDADKAAGMLNSFRQNDLIVELAKTAISHCIRLAALERITDRASLISVAEYTASPDIKIIVYEKLGQPEMVSYIRALHYDFTEAESHDVLKNVHKDEQIQYLAGHAKSENIRVAAIRKLDDPQQIEQFIDDRNLQVRKVVADALGDPERFYYYTAMNDRLSDDSLSEMLNNITDTARLEEVVERWIQCPPIACVLPRLQSQELMMCIILNGDPSVREQAVTFLTDDETLLEVFKKLRGDSGDQAARIKNAVIEKIRSHTALAKLTQYLDLNIDKETSIFLHIVEDLADDEALLLIYQSLLNDYRNQAVRIKKLIIEKIRSQTALARLSGSLGTWSEDTAAFSAILDRLTDHEALLYAAEKSKYWESRSKIYKKLGMYADLAIELLESDDSYAMRRFDKMGCDFIHTAFADYPDQKKLERAVTSHKTHPRIAWFVPGLKNPDVIRSIALDMDHVGRLEAVKLMRDEEDLVRLITDDNINWRVRVDLIESVRAPALLKKIADSSDNIYIRKTVFQKLRDKESLLPVMRELVRDTEYDRDYRKEAYAELWGLAGTLFYNLDAPDSNHAERRENATRLIEYFTKDPKTYALLIPAAMAIITGPHSDYRDHNDQGNRSNDCHTDYNYHVDTGIGMEFPPYFEETVKAGNAAEDGEATK